MESVDGGVESPGGGSGELGEAWLGSLGGSPATEGALGFDGESVGGSSLFPGEAVELPGKPIGSIGSAEAATGGGVEFSPLGSPVFAGGAMGLGKDAGLAVLAGGVVCFGTVVGYAGAGIGVGVAGVSQVAGVNAIGGSKRSNVVSPYARENIPVFADAHIGSRENISMGDTIDGSQDGPIVRVTLPSVPVLFPKP